MMLSLTDDSAVSLECTYYLLPITIFSTANTLILPLWSVFLCTGTTAGTQHYARNHTALTTQDTIDAVVLHAPHKIGVEMRPKPIIVEPTDAVVKVIVAGICGSELHPTEGIKRPASAISW